MAGKMEKIKDVAIAQQILEKVNSFNIEVGLKAVAICGAYSALPSDASQTILLSAGVVGLLYLIGSEKK